MHHDLSDLGSMTQTIPRTYSKTIPTFSILEDANEIQTACGVFLLIPKLSAAEINVCWFLLWILAVMEIYMNSEKYPLV